MPELQTAYRQETGRRTRLSSSREPVQSLVAAGKIAVFKKGNRSQYTAPIPRRNLYELLQLAEEKKDENKKLRPGRRAGVDSDRMIETLTKSQFQHIRSWCNHIARHFLPDAGRKRELLRRGMERVGSEYFIWNPDGGPGGNGDWSPMLAFVTTVAEALDRDPEDAVTAMRNLLDLAATHAWIPRTERHQEDYDPVPAEWATFHNEARATCMGDVDRLPFGLMKLLEGCARLDMDPRLATPEHWELLTEHMEEWFQQQAEMTSRDRGTIRATYRALRTRGFVDGPDWDGRKRQQQNAISLVSYANIRRLGNAYGVDEGLSQEGITADQVGAGFPWQGFEDYPGLVDGSYGLRPALHHCCAPEMLLRKLGIPSRAAAGGNSRTEWSEGTINYSFGLLNRYLGWLEEARSLDFSEPGSDLRVVIEEKALDAFYEGVMRGEVGSKYMLLRLAGILSMWATDFCVPLAKMNGNAPLAESFDRASSLLNSDKGVGNRASIAVELRTETSIGTIDAQKREARAVEKAWTGHGQYSEYAYDQMENVRDILITRLENLFGSPLENIVDEVAAGSFRIPRELAWEIQLVLFWADQLVVPLRRKTSHLLDFSERKHWDDFGKVWAEIPAWKMKRKASFSPNYCKEAPNPYPASVYRLHVMTNGGRQVLRTDATGRYWDTPAFYVPDVESVRGDKDKKPRIEPDVFSDLVSRAVERALDFDPDCLGGLTLDRLTGVLTQHRMRHAFGTRFAREGLEGHAAKMLHHKDTRMVELVYSDYDESHIDGVAALKRATNRAESAT